MNQQETYFDLFLRFLREAGYDSKTLYDRNLTDDFNDFLEKQSCDIDPVDNEKMAFIIMVASLGS